MIKRIRFWAAGVLDKQNRALREELSYVHDANRVLSDRCAVLHADYVRLFDWATAQGWRVPPEVL